MYTDLKVGRFWGEMGVDFWGLDTWVEKLEAFEVRAFLSSSLLFSKSFLLRVIDIFKPEFKFSSNDDKFVKGLGDSSYHHATV